MEKWKRFAEQESACKDKLRQEIKSERQAKKWLQDERKQNIEEAAKLKQQLAQVTWEKDQFEQHYESHKERLMQLRAEHTDLKNQLSMLSGEQPPTYSDSASSKASASASRKPTPQKASMLRKPRPKKAKSKDRRR